MPGCNAHETRSMLQSIPWLVAAINFLKQDFNSVVEQAREAISCQLGSSLAPQKASQDLSKNGFNDPPSKRAK